MYVSTVRKNRKTESTEEDYTIRISCIVIVYSYTRAEQNIKGKLGTK
jgi:hypothetical protein